MAFLDTLLTHSVAVRRAQGLVDLNRAAGDGTRVRASAGTAPFRPMPTLDECLLEAEDQVARLMEEMDDDPAAGSRRQAAAGEVLVKLLLSGESSKSFFDAATQQQANRWKESAPRGNADGQYLYGRALEEGARVEKDAAEAVTLSWAAPAGTYLGERRSLPRLHPP